MNTAVISVKEIRLLDQDEAMVMAEVEYQKVPRRRRGSGAERLVSGHRLSRLGRAGGGRSRPGDVRARQQPDPGRTSDQYRSQDRG